jgi:signal transduction histidine kinase
MTSSIGSDKAAEMLVLFHQWRTKPPAPKNRLAVGNTFGRVAQRNESPHPRRLGIAALMSCLLFQPEPATELKQVRRVAVFYELGLSSPAVALLDREMRAVLDNSRYQIELYPEYLETTLFDEPVEQQQFRESYIRKYQNRRPDIIIALGPSPLRFIVDTHEKFFAGIPIVFGGTSDQQADNPTLDSHFTGCWTNFEPGKTLDVALRLQPGSRHVVVVGGISNFDKHLEAIFRERLHGYEASMDFTYLTDLEMPTLLGRLKHLPDHTIVLYTHLGKDARGIRYVGASQAGPMIADAANAPVFGPSDVDLGRGQVGGYLHSFAQEGKIVGMMAVRILNGERTKDIPIVRGVNAYKFDWRALRRWRFREIDLPPGSEVLFRPPTLWQRTSRIWVAVLVFSLCLSALALHFRLKKAKHRQMTLSGMLITAQETERSRLASEIHDDFSQRLALMALELETAEETIGTSPDEAVQLVHNILNSASELGADLHTLSHRLHSSTLERLGIVPGITALCKEFAVQQSIEIDFLTNDVPRSVHPDVALCLFRIVQEGLRNLKKHSGAAKAQVRLCRIGDKLHVSVSDEGIGFDQHDLGEKEGLGIRSMEERAYLLGGRFEIRSNLGRGTRIEASVPIHPKQKSDRMISN